MIRLGVRCVVLVLTVAACAEGYPPKEPGIELSFDMNLGDTLKVMTRIGGHDYMGARWIYGMEECRLTVQTKGLPKAVGPVVIPIDIATVSMQEEDAGKRFSVHAAWQADGMSAQQLVLDGANWSDARQMKWLLEHLPRRCASGGSEYQSSR